jgi:hypothetical protein
VVSITSIGERGIHTIVADTIFALGFTVGADSKPIDSTQEDRNSQTEMQYPKYLVFGWLNIRAELIGGDLHLDNECG